MKNLSKKFESISAFVAWLDHEPVKGCFVDAGKESSRKADKEYRKFSGTKSYQAANDLLLHGWQEGAARVKAAMIKSAGAMSERPRCYNSVVGFAPNVPNYLAGSPLNMINKKRVRVPARVVDIVYNCTVAGVVDKSDMENTAAKVFNIVAGLEKSGIRVNLYIAMVNHSDGVAVDSLVRIKSASQPFNLLKMVYPCVHPSFFRRHLFALIERAGVDVDTWTDSYGRVITDGDEIKKAVAAMGVKKANILSFYEICGKSEKEIAEMIK